MNKLAINRLRERAALDAESVDRFVERHGSPIIEQERATFLFRGEADAPRIGAHAHHSAFCSSTYSA